MSYLILSNDTRQQLEQERDRLMHDRETIVASVTAQIDQAIQHLNGLLSNESSSTVSTSVASNGAATSEPSGGQGKAAKKSKASSVDAEPTPAAEEPKPKRQAGAKRRKATPFDAKQLKRDFKGMSASDAIVQIMLQSPDQPFATDALIEELYEAFDETEMSRARKSVSAVLMQGARAGKFEKVKDAPGQYKLSEPAAVSA